MRQNAKLRKSTLCISSSCERVLRSVLLTSRRVAEFGKGGAFLKEWETCKRFWLEFSLFLNQFQSVCPKIETKFLGKLRNSKVFFRQSSGDLQEKKKKVFTKIENNFLAEIRNSNVFSVQKQVISKKKRSSPKLRPVFWPKSEIQTFEGGLFSYGGGL